LFGLAFFLLFFPLLSVHPVSDDGYSLWLLHGSFFKTMLIILLTLVALIGRNASFRFKNIVITYFGFKEGDALINFILLWLISTVFLAIGDTISIVNEVTSSVTRSGMYYFIELYLLAGLVMTLISVIKSAKEHSNKTKIINVIDEDASKDLSNKKSLKGLFEDDVK
jgi:hypothetical protein